MDDQNKSKQLLIREIAELRTRLATERKPCQESSHTPTELGLRESENRFRLLFEHLPLGYQSLDENGCILEVNQTWLDTLGYAREQVIGKSFGNFLHPDWTDHFNEKFPHFKSVGEVLGPEFMMVKGDGSIIKISCSGKKEEDDEGNFKRTHCILQDVTERKRSEEALRDSEEQKRLALEAAKLGTWIYTPHNHEIYWDQRNRDIFGVSPDEQIDERKFLSLIHPEDRKIVNNTVANVLDPDKAIVHFVSQYRICLPDGSVRWISSNGKKYSEIEGDGNKAVRVIGTHMDITEYKQAELALRESELRYREMYEEMRALFAAMTDVVFIGNSEGRYLKIVDTNPALLYKPSHELLGKTLHEIFPKEQADFFLNHFMQALKTQQSVNFEYSLVIGDKRHWFNATVSPISDENFLTVARDITKRKQAEEQLRNINENLEQQVAERTKLAEARAKQLQSLAVELIEAEEHERERIANLLHEDLQQLLTAAKFTLESKRRSDPDIKEVQHVLEEAISKSRSLSHQLSPPILRHSGLHAALEWLCQHMHEQFGLNVQIESKTAKQVDSAPLRVFLFRAVKELLFNIVKHADVKDALVTVATSDDEVAVTVSDAGKGFDTALVDAHTPKAGLGLLSLRERTKYIGGCLDIKSAPGQGSRFTLKVPFKVETTLEQAVPASAADEEKILQSTATIAKGTDVRVVFADDHKVMRQGLIRLVSGKPYISVVGEAGNGIEALELAHRLRPDVIVMDVSMPRMDGIEATRRIKTELPDVHVLGLSMHEDENVAEAMRSAGAEAFLSKATSSAKLLDVIYEIAGQGQAVQTKSHEKKPTQLKLPL